MLKIKGTTLLKIYLYLLSFITLTTAIFMGAIVFKAGISYVTPLPFSYSLYEASTEAQIKKAAEEGFEEKRCYDGEVVTVEGTDYCWDGRTREEDLINGISVFVSMLILFGIHQFLIKKTSKRDTPELLIKAYTFVSLFTYSVTGIVAIPTMIYGLANYFINRVSEPIYAPAYSIGLTILVLPLWFIFFNKTSKLKDD